MSTKITEKMIIKGSETDIVLDGLDFTLNGYVEVQNASTITIQNCRVYDMNVENSAKNYWLHIKGDIETKLVIKNCFFGANVGTNGAMYNLIEPTAKLKNGSLISDNYFEVGCCTHNMINIYGVCDNATVQICRNVFETCAGGIRVGVKGEPKCTVLMRGNTILSEDENYEAEWQGLVCVQPYNKETTSFKNMTIKLDNNKVVTEQVVYGYSGSKDTVLDETTTPKVIVNGTETELVIYH